jgi:hypothetical protein
MNKQPPRTAPAHALAYRRYGHHKDNVKPQLAAGQREEVPLPLHPGRASTIVVERLVTGRGAQVIFAKNSGIGGIPKSRIGLRLRPIE